jgi:nucleoside-diphosphate-sugar epimerase
VFGASGFLGRWVARRLSRTGAEIHLALRDPDRGPALGELHRVDASDEAEVSRLIARVEPAVVFNLAGYGVGRDQRDERTSTLLNAKLPGWIARALASTRDRGWTGVRLVHAGSGLEYGSAGGDLRETAECRPATVYGRTKLEGTQAVARIAPGEGGRAGLRAVVARIFTVYGAGERPGRLLPSLLAVAEGGGDVPLGPGTQRRDFVFAEDAAEALVRLALADARPGEIVNLATGRLSSVREFALEAARILGLDERRLRFGALPSYPEEMDHDPVNVARLRELLGGSPDPDLRAGLERAIAGARAPERLA